MCLKYLFASLVEGAGDFWLGCFECARLMCLPSKAFNVCSLHPMFVKVKPLQIHQQLQFSLFGLSLTVAVPPIVKNEKASQSALVTACLPFMFFQKGVHALGPSPALIFVARQMVCVTKRHFFYFVTLLVAGSSCSLQFSFRKRLP